MSGWRPGDHPGARRFLEVGTVGLEAGGRLPVTVAYETFGRPVRDERGRVTNAVLVLHALTGDAHVAGAAGPGQPTAGWWDAVVGPGKALDTDRWFVVAPNVLGGCGGTTGPSTPAPDGAAWGSRFPVVTVRDQVAVELRLSRRLGIDRFVAVLGGSMGGMRALEWVVSHPRRVGAALVLATCAAAGADQVGLQTTQVALIRDDPDWRGGDYHAVGDGRGPITGMGLARRIAHLTYRTGQELEARFGREAQAGEEPLSGGRFAVQSYLEHQAAKLVARFDPGSYVTLTEAMNHHDVGRGRGGVAAALGGISTPLVVAGVDSDRLYPLEQQRQIADLAPSSGGLRVISSLAGHDGFLLEADQVGALVSEAVQRGASAMMVSCTSPARTSSTTTTS